MEMLDPLSLPSPTGEPKPFTWKRRVVIGLFSASLVLLLLNLLTGALGIFLAPVDLGIEGRYFYRAHGWVMEITYEDYIWSKILFIGMIVAFAVTLIIARVWAASGIFGKTKSQSQGIRKRARIILVAGFSVFFVVVVVTVYRAQQEWATHPNPPVRPSKLVLDLESANRFFFQEFGRYPVTPDELVSDGHLHSSGAETLKGGIRLGGFRFTYVSDGKSYECIGQPPPSDPGALVYFLSSRSGDIYCVFQDTDLDQLKEAISKRN